MNFHAILRLFANTGRTWSPCCRAGAAARLRAYAQNGTPALHDLRCHILRLQPVAPQLATAAASSVVPISSSSLSQPRRSTDGGACKRHGWPRRTQPWRWKRCPLRSSSANDVACSARANGDGTLSTSTGAPPNAVTYGIDRMALKGTQNVNRWQ